MILWLQGPPVKMGRKRARPAWEGDEDDDQDFDPQSEAEDTDGDGDGEDDEVSPDDEEQEEQEEEEELDDESLTVRGKAVSSRSTTLAHSIQVLSSYAWVTRSHNV